MSDLERFLSAFKEVEGRRPEDYGWFINRKLNRIEGYQIGYGPRPSHWIDVQLLTTGKDPWAVWEEWLGSITDKRTGVHGLSIVG